jgi:hypothetical protein
MRVTGGRVEVVWIGALLLRVRWISAGGGVYRLRLGLGFW